MVGSHRRKPGLLVLAQSWGLILLAATVALLINHLRPDSLAILRPPTPGNSSKGNPGGTGLSISLEEARRLFVEKRAVFLDARSPKAFEKGRLEAARNLPLGAAEQSAFDVLADVPQDTVLITYCDGEKCILAERLAAALVDMGFQNVRILDNGYTRWVESGLPTEGGPHRDSAL